MFWRQIFERNPFCDVFQMAVQAKDAAADMPRRQVFRTIGAGLAGIVLAAVGLKADKNSKAGRERRKRNIALALALGGVVILFYLMSIVQWHENTSQ